MKDKEKTKEQLIDELGKLQQKLRKLGAAETRQRQTEQILKESEEKYKLLVETSNDMIFTVDLKGNFLFVNKAFKKNLGYSKEEIKKINGFKLLHPEDFPKVRKQFGLLMEGKKVDNMEYRYRAKNSSYIHILNNASPIFDPQGNVVAAFGIARNISQRKKMEEELQRAHEELERRVEKRTAELVSINKKLEKEVAERKKIEWSLRESEEKYRSIFESFQDVYYRTDRDGRITIISPSVYTQAGYNPKELIGQSVTDFYLYPSDREDFLQEIKKSGALNDYELKLKAKDGRVIDASVSSRIMIGKDGEPVGVEGVLRNITERKKMEEELIRLSTAVKMSVDGIIIADLNANIIDVNEAVLKKHGFKHKEEMIGKNSFQFVAPEDREKLLPAIKKMTKKGYILGIEYHILTKEGRKIPVEANGVILKNEHGKPKGFVATVRDITERKRAEETLRESEENYRQLADSIDDVFFEMDKDLRYTYWNKASENLTGISAKKALGKSLYELFPEIRGTKADKFYLKSLKTNKSISFVNEYQLNDRNHFFEINAYPSKRGLSVFVKDITERKKAEEALRESQERAKAQYKGIPMPTATWQKVDDDFVLIDYNDANFKITQGKIANSIGKTASEMYPDMPEIIGDLSRCFNKKLTVTRALEYRFRSTGEIKHMAFTYGYVPPDLVMLHAEDITERKRGEEKYHSLYSAMNEGVCLHEIIYDDKGKAVDYRITDVNPAYESITGLKKEKVVGIKASELYRTDNPPFLNIYAKVANTGKSASIETYFPPLKKYFIISAFSPERGKFATVFTDITERYNTERELIEAKDQAETALKKLKKVQSQLIQSARLTALGKLSAGIAHEINNPLSIISGHTQILLMEKLSGRTELKKTLKIIKKQVDRASSITDQLLQFSKKIKPKLKMSDVNEVLKDTLALLKQQLAEDKIRIVKQLTSEPVFIHADSLQLQQVFLNLIVNASHAMPNGGTLVINTMIKDANLEINFTDTGCGIPEEHLSKLFEPFFTTKENGTGLGLSIAYGIIKAHKGDIKVNSKEGKGTTFTIILPKAL